MIRGAFVLFLVALNTAFWGTTLLLFSIPKLVLRRRARQALVMFLSHIGDRWTATNHRIFDALLPTQWDIAGAETILSDGHYLIFSNHISWTDIFVVLRLFHRRVPFLRFFIKQELIWLPVVGQAAWALDFPFMKRYTAEYLARHPEKRGTDLETTYRACRRFKYIPLAILNFLEATRFTRDKHEEQASPYQYLLRPRLGGAAFVLASLGDLIDGAVDVTIAYPGHEVTMWDFMCGRVPRVVARARVLDVPREFLDRAVVDSPPVRERFRAWIEEIWTEKDRQLAQLL